MRKIFYEEVNITEFDGKVVSCEYDEAKKLCKMLLDVTAFFPEEGGQSADVGTMDGHQRLKDECQTYKSKVNELQAKCLSMSLAALPSPEESENAVVISL